MNINRFYNTTVVCILSVMGFFIYFSHSYADMKPVSDNTAKAVPEGTAMDDIKNSPVNPDNNTTKVPEVVAEANWDIENDYWKKNYISRPYYQQGTEYSNYEPAYKYGVDTYNQFNGEPYDELHNDDLQTGWNKIKGASTLDWQHARDAMRDSYNRIYNSVTPNSGTNATRIKAGTSAVEKDSTAPNSSGH